MKTKVSAFGRTGEFALASRSFYLTRSLFTIEPWSGLYYVFHGACLPLVLQRIVGEYRGYRVRAYFWDREKALQEWQATGHLWIPLIDYVTDHGFYGYIKFSYHPYRIAWSWNMQFGDSKDLNQSRIQELTSLLDKLGSSVKQKQEAEQVVGEQRR